jgi:hypothetical protein
VEAHYSEFLPYYEKLQDTRKERVDEHLYLRMRNFERAAQDAKRLNKAKDKKFDIDFSWQTSLSNEFSFIESFCFLCCSFKISHSKI